MAKQVTWVLVSDAARGRIFELSQDRDLVPAYKRELIGETQPSRDIASDRPGRTFDRSGGGRHAKEPHTDPKRHAKAELAHEIGRVLDSERKKGAYDRLIIVAPPQFLGDLRAAMSKPVQELIVAEVNKDLSKLAPHQLKEQLGDVLAIRPPL
jgi:protein required for attachment to host cells